MTGHGPGWRRQLVRDIRLEAGVIPALFLIIVISLTVFAAGPDRQLLQRVGPGSLWVAALLASLLPVGTLIADDVRIGTFDRLRISGQSLEAIMAIRICAHWLGFAPALLLAAALSIPLVGTDVRMLFPLMLGTIPLAALGIVAAALVSGLRNGSALAGLILLPLALPMLIFGAGGEVRLLAAAGLVLLALSPFAAAAALREATS